MKIEIPSIPGLNIPEFEISHSNEEAQPIVGLAAKKTSNKGVIIAVVLLVLLLLGGRRESAAK